MIIDSSEVLRCLEGMTITKIDFKDDGVGIVLQQPDTGNEVTIAIDAGRPSSNGVPSVIVSHHAGRIPFEILDFMD